MRVKQARAAAQEWVTANADQIPGFCGAFLHGSINWRSDEDLLPAASDVDVVVLLADADPPVKSHKFHYCETLLEISYLRREQFASPELILGQYHLSGSFRKPGILSDPSGQLTRIQAVVSREYARRPWVYRRCEAARDKVLRNLNSVESAGSFPNQVMGWLFAAGVTTHVLLVAGLNNPTVRRRYAAARDLLADYGHLDFHETLLAQLGCAYLSRAQVEAHLTALSPVFDAAQAVLQTPVPFACDLSAAARPIAFEGSQILIEQGLHREAMFWIAVTYSRCMTVLDHDAPAAVQAAFGPGYQRLLGDLGIAASADLHLRCGQIRAGLPEVWRVAEAIMNANPEIEE
ncbi:MAG: hypothetical protein K8J31_16810 [Anaerolineae bacterium]|nr:hypothetical protein [Anaerolineae bacterium]